MLGDACSIINAASMDSVTCFDVPSWKLPWQGIETSLEDPADYYVIEFIISPPVSINRSGGSFNFGSNAKSVYNNVDMKLFSQRFLRSLLSLQGPRNV